jgi:hypothetical protein
METRRIRHIQNPDKVTGTIIGASSAPRFRGQVNVEYDNGETYFTPIRFLISNDSDAALLKEIRESTLTESDGEEPLESSEEDKSVLIED